MTNPHPPLPWLLYHSGYNVDNPDTWAVMQPGRETETRYYRLAVKPANRWTGDGYIEKKRVVATFDSAAEAEKFRADMLGVWNASLDTVKAAWQARDDADTRYRDALKARREKVEQRVEALLAAKAAGR